MERGVGMYPVLNKEYIHQLPTTKMSTNPQ